LPQSTIAMVPTAARLSITSAKLSLDELEKSLGRGLPPAANASRAELQKYLSKFKILLVKEEDVNEGGSLVLNSPSFGVESPNNKSLTSPPQGALDAPRRRSVQGKKTDVSAALKFKPRHVEKNPITKAELLTIAAQCPSMSHLDEHVIAVLVDAMQPRSFPAGTVIYAAGEASDNAELFFILRGEVALQGNKSTPQKSLKKGKVFGEEEVMNNSARAAMALAVEETLCYGLDEELGRNILTAGAHNKRERYVKWLEKIPWLQNLERKNKIQLADALESRKYRPGEVIISFGQVGEWLHIIEEGTVKVMGYDQSGKKLMTDKEVCTFTEGECVGELEMIAMDPTFRITQADVIAQNEVRTARLHKKHFELCLGPIKDLLYYQVATLEKFEYIRQRMQSANE